MKPKVKISKFNPPDFPLSYLRRGKKIWHAADRFGYVGILTKGKRSAYLVSHKFWQNDMLKGEGFVTITGYGKVRGYLMPVHVWNVFLGFLRCVTPARRSRLPDIAANTSRRYAEESKMLTVKEILDEQIARKLA